ncbi:hypothetical protein OIO90_003910 [Microbotryomycetes sp. JL221]|nr:hypothetical protein OIO90_003910 [Microbotryomycetes sp. JL221]
MLTRSCIDVSYALALLLLLGTVNGAFQPSNSCLDDYLKAINAPSDFKGVADMTCTQAVYNRDWSTLSYSPSSDGMISLPSQKSVILASEPFCHVKITNKGSTTSKCDLKKYMIQYDNARYNCPRTIGDFWWVGAWVELSPGCNMTITGDRSCASLGLPELSGQYAGACDPPCKPNQLLTNGVCKSCNSLGKLDIGKSNACGGLCKLGYKPVGSVCKTCASLNLPASTKQSFCGGPCKRDEAAVNGVCQSQTVPVLKALGLSSSYIETFQKYRPSVSTVAGSKIAIDRAFLDATKGVSKRSVIELDTIPISNELELERRATTSCPDLPPPKCQIKPELLFQNESKSVLNSHSFFGS